ncbi:asparagine synthase (glutamine-hydrolyzing) [Methyloterricola oryzae]|uniref:asparagine synthase (glutamine-hydrolyzing) n=1 Tax=Methyloterricola oryzae TaxID=1495050 RepID=UPI0005EAF32B|nr:asparagine synthase (glutamine-hydrolyzing) [Methyloterricola oryzae]
MCGLVGAFSPGQAVDVAHLRRLSSLIQHRGPDDEGIYLDREVGFCVAHQRLAILDLSPAGHQPMQSRSGRYVITYNGEIYNHLGLRQTLLAQDSNLSFRGSSDTETLLAAIEHWGVEKALEYCNGMFVFALWDKSTRRLCLARDRMGEKPLYVGWLNGTIVFSSELKPILSCYPVSLDSEALGLMLGLGYVPAPWSIVNNVFKLPAAHYLWLRESDANRAMDIEGFRAAVRAYWSLPEIAANALRPNDSAKPGIEEAEVQLECLLKESVRDRMLSDVPLGACLSGGIDSTSIVALMQAVSDRPIKTFTIGFEESGFDEAVYAGKVAQHLGTAHTEARLKATDALDLIPKLPQVYDEPFADSSQLPTLLLTSLIRQHVKVALSGDGGDELFFGYGRYSTALRLWRSYSKLPHCCRRWLDGNSSPLFSYRLWRLLRRLAAPNFDAFYLAFSSPVPDPAIFSDRSRPLWDVMQPLPKGVEELPARMMYRDQTLYLPDDILVKVDRASMAVGLEMRVPLLDHRLVEWAWGLPFSFKYRDGSGKWLLRQVLCKYVPSVLFERPKQGFGIPIDDWLRGPLREWAEELLSHRSLAICPQLNASAVQGIWRQHCQGRINAGYALWNVLMLMAWLQEWRLCVS